MFPIELVRKDTAPRRALARLLATVRSWRRRRARRVALARILEADPKRLKDLGLMEADVARDCARPFWRP